MQEFKLDKKYVIGYWITLSTYFITFVVLLVTMCYSFNAPLENPWARRIGFVIMLAGWGIWYFGRRKLGHESIDIDPLGELTRLVIYRGKKTIRRTHKEIVETGIYKITRHPQYWGTVIFYIGLSLALASLPALAVSIVLVLPAHIWRAAAEERMLGRIYGEKYNDYKRKVKL